MDFVSAVKEVKSKYGVAKAFHSMLCDYGAYNEEEGWVKIIMKQICDNGYSLQLLNSNTPDGQWIVQVSDMIYRLNSQYGYDKGNCSYILHKLALGFGLIDDSFDWSKEFPPYYSVETPSGTSAVIKSKYCPYCGHAYYKVESAYCAFCGKPRK